MKKATLTLLAWAVIALTCSAYAEQLDLGTDTIPKKFKGDDIVNLVEALSKSANVPGKVKLIHGPFNKNDTERIYAFRLADDKVYASPAGVWVEKMTANSWSTFAPTNIYPPYSRRYEHMPEDHYLIRDMGKKESSYIGQNIFGAKTRVHATTEKRYFVAPINGTGNIGKLAVKAENAKIGVIFICKPARHSQDEGYIAFPGKGYNATWDSPYSLHQSFYSVRVELQEVWVYDQNSGKVLLKHKVTKQLEPETVSQPTKPMLPSTSPKLPPPRPPIRGY